MYHRNSSKLSAESARLTESAEVISSHPVTSDCAANRIDMHRLTDGKMCGSQELSVKNFGLDHDRPDLFVVSQWQPGGWWYPVYRCVVMLYLVVTLIYMTATTPFKLKWLIFVSNWTFTLLTLSAVFRCVTCCIHAYNIAAPNKRDREYRRTSRDINESQLPLSIMEPDSDSDAARHPCVPETHSNQHAHQPPADTDVGLPVAPSNRMPVSLKASWVLYNVSCTASLLVSLMYWTIDYDVSKPLTFYRVNIHAVNTCLVIVDVLLTSLPIRLLHAYQPMVYSALYALFSAAYWACGGTGHGLDTYIYKTIDYSRRPGLAVGLLVGVSTLGCIVGHGIMFSLYKFRTVCLTNLFVRFSNRK